MVKRVTVTATTNSRRSLWFERLMAITATANLGLVMFDLSYLQWRDFYLRSLPALTQMYDPIKGIEPHRETQHYLNRVNALQEQVSQTGLKSQQAEIVLKELRSLSVEMIENNPFEVANKSGTLEKIKNRLRDRLEQESSRQAFTTFWSQSYLSKAGWQQEINFFNQAIQPLIATNYYRQIGENGEFTDHFWRLDLPFVILFSSEFLARTWLLSRRHTTLGWGGAMIWRWYDILLMLPFWRWLRFIPVLIRLDQANLLNLHPVRQQIHRSVITNFAEELTSVVVVRVIDQIQDSIRRGEILRWLRQPKTRRQYIDINNVNEVEAITSLLVQQIVYQVLPKIKPDVVALLDHNIKSVLNQSPVYNSWQKLPGIEDLSGRMTEQLATQITQSFYDALVAAVEDPVAAKLSSQLVHNFSAALNLQLQKEHTLDTIQSLLLDMLEEVKLNYVKHLSPEDVERIIDQTMQLRSSAIVNQVVNKDFLPKRSEN